MADYISTSDITDKLVNSFGSTLITAKIALSTLALNDMAATKGVDSDDIETDPVHWIIKKWCISYVGQEICLDHMGVNNNEFAEQEKYRVKFNDYRKLVKEYQSMITPAILLGNTDTIRERANVKTGVLFRG